MDPFKFQADNRLLFGRWNYIIMKELLSGPKRYSDIKRTLPITGTALTDRLRLFEAENLIMRRLYPEMPIRVEYALTDKGEALRPIVEAFERWISHYNEG
ncbi:winged helix-turn-helix transcriptional regulator [Paenibacillus sacheonensis]|uniref:Transcriptional regulator n=1 Tax=Paenibacillus sacheonensis TaxID=742054 RepID=A0A7X4YSX2_9BACL|nr:winged helix-turn-helix transcriptional regulator [Paenibacillus sacheonensis]MBM7569487.1 DNA-binding HxlR family transcriptional regulator [Paenibacillus sacheonensis]NBC71923.1 transcriptional regulator [Paenibacillus sacheonensis]